MALYGITPTIALLPSGPLSHRPYRLKMRELSGSHRIEPGVRASSLFLLVTITLVAAFLALRGSRRTASIFDNSQGNNLISQSIFVVENRKI